MEQSLNTPSEHLFIFMRVSERTFSTAGLDMNCPLKLSSLSCCTKSTQQLPISVASALHVLQHKGFRALHVIWKREASVCGQRF